MKTQLQHSGCKRYEVNSSLDPFSCYSRSDLDRLPSESGMMVYNIPVFYLTSVFAHLKLMSTFLRVHT